MPYFVFRVSADRQLKLVNTCEKYKEAKDLCRELRKSESPDKPIIVGERDCPRRGQLDRRVAAACRWRSRRHNHCAVSRRGARGTGKPRRQTEGRRTLLSCGLIIIAAPLTRSLLRSPRHCHAAASRSTPNELGGILVKKGGRWSIMEWLFWPAVARGSSLDYTITRHGNVTVVMLSGDVD